MLIFSYSRQIYERDQRNLICFLPSCRDRRVRLRRGCPPVLGQLPEHYGRYSFQKTHIAFLRTFIPSKLYNIFTGKEYENPLFTFFLHSPLYPFFTFVQNHLRKLSYERAQLKDLILPASGIRKDQGVALSHLLKNPKINE